MSKAFTRESDDASAEVPIAPRAPLPPGVKNYITQAGARRLQEELARLERERPGGGDDSGRIAARIRQLQEIIASLVIADPPAQEREVVRFGATVEVQRKDGAETYRIVGVDETNLDQNEISWLSPLAKSLLGARVGERVQFRAPAGPEELQILAVKYE